jgi:cytochrome c oxidase subunit 4
MELTYQKKEKAHHMKEQVISFSLMIFFTLLSFVMVMMGMKITVVAPLLLLFAVVQVIFQLFYFMHLKEKGHGAVTLFLFSGVFVGILIIATFMTIIWW